MTSTRCAMTLLRPRAILLVGALTLSLVCSLSVQATVLDPNFTETFWIAAPPSGPTGMAWAPDGSGRLFVPFKDGTVRVIEYGNPPTLLPTPFATVSPIHTDGECGLLGIAFDPDFVSNHFVYFFVTVSGSEQQIIRYTDVGGVGMNKTVVIPGLPTLGGIHDGGGVGFGPDGKIYWSIGDTGSDVGTDADLTSLAAKVGRAWVEGTVPEDNPFIDGPGPNNDFIWARGFRNPFTLTFQPATGRLWVDVAGDLYEQIFAPLAGDHAGWKTYENNQPSGFITPSIKYRTNGFDVRNIAGGGATRHKGVVTFTTTVTHGFRVGEKITVSGVADSSFNGDFYVTDTPSATTFTVAQAGPHATSGGGTATTQALGGAVTGGAFYDGTGFPSTHQGNFFFGDFSGKLMRARVGPGTTVTSVDLWSQIGDNLIDVAPGPDGALYYIGYQGSIYRTTYNAVTQALVLSDTHMTIHEGQAAVFTVRLAMAPAFPVTVSVARTAGSPDVTVSAGSTLTFTPANWDVPQIVRLSATDDSDLVSENATLTASSTGLTSQTVQVNLLDLSGVSGAAGPGRVPDGAAVPGVPLTITRSTTVPGSLDLDWGPSCAASANDYSIQEGSLGAWYSHTAIRCSTGGVSAATIEPAGSGRYYLIVPLDAQREGSYGADSSGVERPRPGAHCRTRRETAGCP